MGKRTEMRIGWVVLSFLVGAFGAHRAHAGVVFTPPLKAPGSTSPAIDEEEFPESHFGPRGTAAQEVLDMESPDEETGRVPGPSRGIASVGSGETPLITSQAAASQEIPDSLVARRGVQEVSIIASDLGYFPKTVFVSRDVPVRMYVTGASKNTLCIMMDSFQIRKQIKAQKIEEITFVPNVPGKYRFYCPVNGMEGMVVVKDLAETPEASQAYEPAPGSGEAATGSSSNSANPAAAAAGEELGRGPGTYGGAAFTRSARAPANDNTSERRVPQVTSGWQSSQSGQSGQSAQ